MSEEGYERWVRIGSKEELEQNDILETIEGFDNQLSWIEQKVNTDPEDAYLSLMTVVILFNRALALRLPKLPNVEKRLKGWINHVRSTVAKLVSKLPKANGYSIGVSFPWGISVSISFSP